MVVKRSTERKHGKMENLKLYTVTKPSSDGTFVTGDIIQCVVKPLALAMGI